MQNLKTASRWMLVLSVCLLTACNSGSKNTSVEINTPEEVQAEKAAVADVADASFTDGMTGKVFHNYLHLRRALVAADAEEAQLASSEMSEAFTEERAGLKELAEEIADTDEIAVQRALFRTLTEALDPLFKDGLSEGRIYKQHCPMAFNNQGANWFSDTPAIENPYYGDQMLHCGKVIETIKK